MIKVRKSHERGSAEHGWLHAKHSFSFSDYYDPEHMGFRSLRVINEDRIDSGMGFPTHGHKDMEIITYVISGALEHKDSMGNGSIIHPGEVQYMSAGSGVRHSEFNPSSTASLHLLQIWILPDITGAKPQYDQKKFNREAKLNQLCLIASNDTSASTQAIQIRQNAKIYSCILSGGNSLQYTPTHGYGQWLQIITGDLNLNDKKLSSGDAAAIDSETVLKLQASTETEFLLFDLK